MSSKKTGRVAIWPYVGQNLPPAPPKSVFKGANGGARTRARRIPADLRADSLITVPPMPCDQKEELCLESWLRQRCDLEKRHSSSLYINSLHKGSSNHDYAYNKHQT
ncbi:hypothetical protein PoB_004547300 [Plakobranchus ocellatus]|uniref:Uncharacterized protein n=1 Tax=Plakobranchus ocellatus TaxID=259542 RepID=A0AAV4BH92_9GAST|nr:hypothetical protein PoB_004547300 [Plakobranchus ocellatus]